MSGFVAAAHFAATVLTGTALLSVAASQFEVVETSWMVLVRSFVSSVIGAVYYVSGKMYCILTEEQGRGGAFTVIFEKLILPVLASLISIDLLYFMYQQEGGRYSAAALMSVVGYGVLLSDWFGLNRKYILGLRGVGALVQKARTMSAAQRAWTIYSPCTWAVSLIGGYVTIQLLLVTSGTE